MRAKARKTRGGSIRIRRVCTVLAMVATACIPAGTSWAQLNEHEYDLDLPTADGGSVDPAARAGDGDADARGSEETPQGAAPSATIAPVEPDAGETAGAAAVEQGRGETDDSHERRYPRGETFALGRAEQQSATAGTAPSSGSDTRWGLLAAVATVGVLLSVAALWRHRTREQAEE